MDDDFEFQAKRLQKVFQIVLDLDKVLAKHDPESDIAAKAACLFFCCIMLETDDKFTDEEICNFVVDTLEVARETTFQDIQQAGNLQ